MGHEQLSFFFASICELIVKLIPLNIPWQSNIESGEIEGFSTDEERDEDLLELDSDTVPR